MVRGAEGSLGKERTVALHLAGDGVYLGGFESFVQGERRQYRGDAFGHHRFSGTRRAYHDEVVTAGGSHFEGAFYVFLPFHVGKVEVEVVLGGEKFGTGVDDGGGQFPVAVEEVDHLFDVIDPIDVEPVDDGGLPHIGAGHDEPLEPLCPRQYGNGKGTAYGEYRAVEREFAHNHVAVEFLGRNLFGGGQYADGQRQVIGRPLFAQVGRGEIDDELPVREFVAVVLQGRAYAFVALFHGRVGQPHHVEVNALRTVHLDGDGEGVDALHGCSEYFDQHLVFLLTVIECLFLFFPVLPG